MPTSFCDSAGDCVPAQANGRIGWKADASVDEESLAFGAFRLTTHSRGINERLTTGESRMRKFSLATAAAAARCLGAPAQATITDYTFTGALAGTGSFSVYVDSTSI